MPVLPSALALDTSVGPEIKAGEHNSNYTQIQAAFNQLLTVLESGTGGQTLTGSGATLTFVAPSSVNAMQVYDRVVATTDVQNLNTEQTVYTKDIAANDLGTNKTARLKISGDWLYNHSATDTCTLRFKFGGTTFFADQIGIAGGIANRRQPWSFQVDITNLNAANSQWCEVEAFVARADAVPTTGMGALFATTGESGGVGGPANATPLAIDTTNTATLLVTAQWNTASPNNSFRLRRALLELG